VASVRLVISFIIRRAFGIRNMFIKLEYGGQVESFITSIKITVLRDFKPVNSSEYFSLIIPLFLLSLIVSLLDFSRFFS
jgi:hypothetical protein